MEKRFNLQGKLNKKSIGISILVFIILCTSAFLMLTKEIIDDVKPDPLVYNKDTSNSKLRPFIVDKQEYPFKSNWFNKDGVSMHYVDEGEGIPIVLCHGNPEWSFSYRNIIKELSDEARLIAYDLPGYGFSDVPEGYNFTPQEHAKWVEALLFEHLKLEKFILVVQDWGGPIGLTIATKYPEKVKGIVISNTWAFNFGFKVNLISKLADSAIARRLILNRNFFAKTLMNSMLSEEDRKNKAIMNAYLMPFPTPKDREATLIVTQIFKQRKWEGELEDKLKILADKPVEFIFGLKDDFVGTEKVKNKWMSYFPDANVQEVAHSNHFTQEDTPESYFVSIRRLLKVIQENK